MTKTHKITHTKTDTVEVTPDLVARWKAPPFQRPLRVNAKVLNLVDEIRNDEVIPGILTLGILKGETYLLDGQHRVHAFTLTSLPSAYADVRTFYCETLAQMGDEFVKLNSRLVNLKPDDILKGLEAGSEALMLIREKCPWVGYDQIRRGPRTPVLGMSQALRCWDSSAGEVPTGTSMGAAAYAQQMSVEDAEMMISFLKIAAEAWGRDPENYRLWGSLNLAVSMWAYRRFVLQKYSANTPLITKDLFRKCMQSLAADSVYNDFLRGRNLTERDRSPCYVRLKAICAARIEEETKEKPRLPSPPWAHGGGGKGKSR